MTRFATSMFLSSEVHDPGAPARSAPAVVEKGGKMWRLAVRAQGPHHVVVAFHCHGKRPARWEIDVSDSESAAEVAVRGLAEGLSRLGLSGATRVTVVVTDQTLAGYLWRGWRPRSLRMRQALEQLLKRAEGLEVGFVRHAAPSGATRLTQVARPT